MDSEFVKFAHQDNVGIITLNRPEARNALSPAMFAELGQAVLDLVVGLKGCLRVNP